LLLTYSDVTTVGRGVSQPEGLVLTQDMQLNWKTNLESHVQVQKNQHYGFVSGGHYAV